MSCHPVPGTVGHQLTSPKLDQGLGGHVEKGGQGHVGEGHLKWSQSKANEDRDLVGAAIISNARAAPSGLLLL